MTFCRVHLIDDIFAGCIEFPSLDGFVDSCLFDNYLDTERMGKEYEITSSNQTRRWKSPHIYVYIYIEERERERMFLLNDQFIGEFHLPLNTEGLPT